MGVADHDEVAAVDVVGNQARTGSPVDPVNVGIQEYDEVADRQPESRAAIPVKGMPSWAQRYRVIFL